MRHLLDTKVGDYQAMVPMVDIDTIGAGGGSIAYVDAGGVFRVGPQSAGADPGPACYGRGGDGADLDRRAAPARAAAPRPRAARRRHAARRRARARQAMATVAEQLGMSRRGGRARRAADPEVRHDAGDRAQLGAPRLRPARVHPRRGRRRRRRCSPATSRSELEIPRVLVPPHPGHHRRRPACSRPTSQHEFVATERHVAADARPRRLERALRRARAAQAAAQLDADGVPGRPRGSCGASPTAATPARATRCASTCPPGAIDDAWVGSRPRAFHAAHERGVRAALRRRDRDRQRPRGRHRPRRRAALGRASRPATATRRAR